MFQAKGTTSAKAPRQKRWLACLGTKDKNVAGEKGMRGMGWEDMRSERLREACRS